MSLGMKNWENCLKTVVIIIIVLGDNSGENKTQVQPQWSTLRVIIIKLTPK